MKLTAIGVPGAKRTIWKDFLCELTQKRIEALLSNPELSKSQRKVLENLLKQRKGLN